VIVPAVIMVAVPVVVPVPAVAITIVPLSVTVGFLAIAVRFPAVAFVLTVVAVSLKKVIPLVAVVPAMAVIAVAQVAFTPVDFGLRLSTGHAQRPAVVVVVIAGPALSIVITVLPPVLAHLPDCGIGIVACPLMRWSIRTTTVVMIRQRNRGKTEQ
jgi:hypothetical protein